MCNQLNQVAFSQCGSEEGPGLLILGEGRNEWRKSCVRNKDRNKCVQKSPACLVYIRDIRFDILVGEIGTKLNISGTF